MEDFDFKNIIYKRPFSTDTNRFIEELIGFDSEAYTNGKPFMFCTSDGEEFTLEDIPQIFFARRFRNNNFAIWNLKYDSGAILYNLPHKYRKELQVNLKTKHNGFRYEYIPHKILKITRGRNSIKFWDIAQFYSLSLDNAACKYLGKHKIDIGTKKFTKEYVKKHREEIKTYCIKDAKLAEELGIYLLKNLWKFGIYPPNLHSTASISYRYFKKHAKIVDVWRFWRENKGLLKNATDAYKGGKFEVYARGRFKGYEYDLNSAYAYEIMNLVDITDAEVIYSPYYQHNCIYGFLRVLVEELRVIELPTAIKDRLLNIYPLGKFETTITKEEYDYLTKTGTKVEILSGTWLKVKRKYYPFRKQVIKLWNMKERTKGKSEILYTLSKLMLNSFYGKMAQIIKLPDGRLLAGRAWNPIYAAVITANVRIRITDIKRYLGRACLAVHTDSILTTKTIPQKYISNKIGMYSLRESGHGVIIACGVYQIGKKSADRGLRLPKGFTWLSTLRKNKNKDRIKIPEIKVITWLDATNRNKPNLVNRFIEKDKEFNLNSDRKRNWTQTATGESLLNNLEQSAPRIKIEV